MVAIQLKRLVSLIALCTLVSSSTIQRVQRADNLDNVRGNPNAQNGSPSTPDKDVGPPAEIHFDFHPNGDGSNHNGQAGSHSPSRMNIVPLPISHRSVESNNGQAGSHSPNRMNIIPLPISHGSDNGQAGSQSPNRMNIIPLPISHRSVESNDDQVGSHSPNRMNIIPLPISHGSDNGQAGFQSPNRMNIIPLPVSRRSAENTNKNPDDKKPNSDAGDGEPSIHPLNRPDIPVLGNARLPRSIEHQNKRTVVGNHAPDGGFHHTDQMKRLVIDGEPVTEAKINKNFQDGQQETESLDELGSEPQME